MKAEEIKIGNWFWHKGEKWSYRNEDARINGFEFQWNETDWYAIGECTLSLEDVEPIQLTEDWLLKLGWVKKESIWSYKEIDITSWFTFRFSTNPLKVQEINYVHQLQNIYFSLTDEELKVN